ncbi:MAG: M1 family aminopeptidase [Bacteroidota bacterium]
MKQIIVFLMGISLFGIGCNSQKIIVAPAVSETEYRDLDTLSIVAASITPGSTAEPEYELEPYADSYTRAHDLLHTSLDVRFDWDKQYVYGKATLTLKPYFYPSNRLVLDAKGFEVHSVQLISESDNKDLVFNYDGNLLSIQLGRTFTREEEYSLFIDYTAKPNERTVGGSNAITQDKGLYFINPLNEDPDKPQQIWTQGETESNSAWFPTIDKPNERCTQEIKVTVQDRFETLSNGVLKSSTKNDNGTRTDYYVMEKPHAPYLFMLAIGEFAVVREEWNGIPIEYYVEKEYEPYAKNIYMHTPEMLTFFSEKLGVTYPWPKYSQVIVKDYVSGAMENTTGVIYGDFCQKTDRELIDNTNEGICAHELIHHWFGNLVTCESWSNLPLNESFANYGEFLWTEYKHGIDAANFLRLNEASGYISTSRGGVHDLIWFGYDDKEDMFDAHSYNKGGAILHMLRTLIGDDAFFATLNKYLTDNAYTDVEAHELRLALEEITGQDWNWFFNQWFYDKGHPMLDVNTEWIEAENLVRLTVTQTQNPDKMRPIFELPVKVEVHTGARVAKHEIMIDQREQVFEFQSAVKPDWVNFDAEKYLLAQINHTNKTEAEYIFQFYNAQNFHDRYESVEYLRNHQGEAANKVLTDALKDPFWYIRNIALDGVDEPSLETVKGMAKTDPRSNVRATAFGIIGREGSKSEVAFLESAIEAEQPYRCVSEALFALVELDKEAAGKMAATLKDEQNASIIVALGGIFSESGAVDQIGYYEERSKYVGGFSIVSFYGDYMNLALQGDASVQDRALNHLKSVATNYEFSTFGRYAALKTMNDLKKHYAKEASKAEGEESVQLQDRSNLIQDLLDEYIEKEPSASLKRFIDGFGSGK